MDEIKEITIPTILTQIPQPPKRLYGIGEIPSPEEYTYLCVIGSRKCSEYGKRACRELLSGLVGYPIVIVSGLALGIDTIAHISALENGILTVAFPGSGLAKDALYPASNYHLAEAIVKNKGCLLSEFENHIKGAHWTFPMRNRLMAGISQAVLIIEAEHESGTLITADMAMEYGRDVFIVPGSIFSETSFGTNNLIKQGATPITHSEQLLEELGFTISSHDAKDSYKNCSDEEKEILTLLKQPMQRSELIRNLAMPTHKANVLISAMEIKGLLGESLGELYRR